MKWGIRARCSGLRRVIGPGLLEGSRLGAWRNCWQGVAGEQLPSCLVLLKMDEQAALVSDSSKSDRQQCLCMLLEIAAETLGDQAHTWASPQVVSKTKIKECDNASA